MSRSPFIVSEFEIKSVKEDNPDYFIVEGFASVYGNIDSYRDIVMPGAFAKDLLENGNERPILWQHRSDEPIGIGTFEEKGTTGLYVTIQMPRDDDFVKKRVMPQIKCGAIKGLSIGYFTVIEEYDRDQKVNKLKECKLRETSAVTFPANELAQITAAKQFLGIEEDIEKSTSFTMYQLADEKTEWDAGKAISNIKANTGSEDGPSKHYKKCFMFADTQKSEKFEGYKLPYAYYKDGEFRIVPKAIYSITGSLAGNRDDLSIPEIDKKEIKNYINQVYKKMGKEEPFKSGGKTFIDTATLKAMEKSDIVTALKDSENIIFSTNAVEMIASALRSSESKGSVNDEKSGSESLGGLLGELNKIL